MLNYAVCEISGKQYKIIPGKVFEVSLQKESRQEIDFPVLLSSEDNTLKIGNPYLKEKLKLTRVEDAKGGKIRVSRFHAKANYRRTTGYRSKITKLILSVKKS